MLSIHFNIDMTALVKYDLKKGMSGDNIWIIIRNRCTSNMDDLSSAESMSIKKKTHLLLVTWRWIVSNYLNYVPTPPGLNVPTQAVITGSHIIDHVPRYVHKTRLSFNDLCCNEDAGCSTSRITHTHECFSTHEDPDVWLKLPAISRWNIMSRSKTQ